MKLKYVIVILIFFILTALGVFFKVKFYDKWAYDKEKQKVIQLANTYYEREDYDVAKKFVENLLISHPDDADLLNLLNKIIAGEKEKEGLARFELNQLAELEKQRYLNLINDLIKKLNQKEKAIVYESKKETIETKKEEVVTKEKKVKYIDNEELERLLNESLTAYNNKDYVLAKSLLYEALNIDSENPIINALLAAVLFEENPEDDKNIEEASKRAKFSLGKDNLLEIAHFTLAGIYNVKGLNEQSISEYVETLKINPNKYEACYAIGKIYYQNQDYQNAEIYFINAINIKSDFVICYYYLSLTENYLNKNDLAKEYLVKAILLDPKFYYAYARLGEIYQAEKKYNDAINNYRKAYDLNNNYEYLINMASCYESNGQYNEAVFNYDRVIIENKIKTEKDRKQMLLCYEKIVLIKIESNDDIAALLYIKKCIDSLGSYAAGMYILSGDIKSKKGKYKEAVLDYSAANENESDGKIKSGTYYKIGLCYYKMNEFSKSVNSFKNAIDENPEFYDGYYRLGEVYYNWKKFNEAKNILIDLKNMNPFYKEIDKVNLILEEINNKVEN